MMTILKKKRESDRKLIDARLKRKYKVNVETAKIILIRSSFYFLNSIDNNG